MDQRFISQPVAEAPLLPADRLSDPFDIWQATARPLHGCQGFFGQLSTRRQTKEALHLLDLVAESGGPVGLFICVHRPFLSLWCGFVAVEVLQVFLRKTPERMRRVDVGHVKIKYPQSSCKTTLSPMHPYMADPPFLWWAWLEVVLNPLSLKSIYYKAQLVMMCKSCPNYNPDPCCF